MCNAAIIGVIHLFCSGMVCRLSGALGDLGRLLMAIHGPLSDVMDYGTPSLETAVEKIRRLLTPSAFSPRTGHDEVVHG
jgi:hypothetical protein